MTGGAGADQYKGGNGNDTINVDNADFGRPLANIVDGGAGYDTLVLQAGGGQNG